MEDDENAKDNKKREKPEKKAGRKKVAQRKKVNRPKQKGSYQKSLQASTADIAECLFSDDEVRKLK